MKSVSPREMTKKTIGCTILMSLLLSVSVRAETSISVSVTNLTHGLHFTPLAVSLHKDSFHFFEAGGQASNNLQAMAEGGDIAGLVTDATNAAEKIVSNPAEGLLAPGATTDNIAFSRTEGDAFQYLSAVAMVLPSNDGFMGLNSWKVPTEPGTYTINVNAYDAGTEANNELIVDGSGAVGVIGIPAAPGGDAGINGTGVTTADTNHTIHIHRSTLGDQNLSGGVSDLSSTVHRWLNPVARITVTVQ